MRNGDDHELASFLDDYDVERKAMKEQSLRAKPSRGPGNGCKWNRLLLKQG